jgi:hypothetical protein
MFIILTNIFLCWRGKQKIHIAYLQSQTWILWHGRLVLYFWATRCPLKSKCIILLFLLISWCAFLYSHALWQSQNFVSVWNTRITSCSGVHILLQIPLPVIICISTLALGLNRILPNNHFHLRPHKWIPSFLSGQKSQKTIIIIHVLKCYTLFSWLCIVLPYH